MDDEAQVEEGGTVDSTSPLTVWTDADPVNACPAVLDASVTVSASDRVRLSLRPPRLPLVVGTL